jgi:hypothetical protein
VLYLCLRRSEIETKQADAGAKNGAPLCKNRVEKQENESQGHSQAQGLAWNQATSASIESWTVNLIIGRIC